MFINGRLAADLGGVHPETYATVLLDASNGHGLTRTGQNCAPSGDIDFELELGSIYEVVVFQAERWCCGSNYWLTLTNFLAGRSTCEPDCGDGVVTLNEACDLGTDPETGASRNNGAYGGCNPDCTLPDYCGDGIVNGPEQCDLGADNQDDPYGPDLCSTACLVPPYCGDGLVDAEHEDCDGQGSCSPGCTWVVPE